ncbi:uncharacterized protein KY384_003333 [Bacidia gigantensis]|uniref:uncharacterized protein n=1 Tax=Bacidia gigantensis TaxID=2732470 RepID=UPI001D053C07|nr:uncharacterized protein KY384_003333 [Bacidia gigantensis]KAG8531701.1 hypothetical protein KY384_003333 [Bacidia gigantensis]
MDDLKCISRFIDGLANDERSQTNLYFAPDGWKEANRRFDYQLYESFIIAMVRRISCNNSNEREIELLGQLITSESDPKFMERALPHFPSFDEPYPFQQDRPQMAKLFMWLRPKVFDRRTRLNEVQFPGGLPDKSTICLAPELVRTMMKNMFGINDEKRLSKDQNALFASTLQLGFPNQALEYTSRCLERGGLSPMYDIWGFPTGLRLPEHPTVPPPRVRFANESLAIQGSTARFASDASFAHVRATAVDENASRPADQEAPLRSTKMQRRLPKRTSSFKKLTRPFAIEEDEDPPQSLLIECPLNDDDDDTSVPTIIKTSSTRPHPNIYPLIMPKPSASEGEESKSQTEHVDRAKAPANSSKYSLMIIFRSLTGRVELSDELYSAIINAKVNKTLADDAADETTRKAAEELGDFRKLRRGFKKKRERSSDETSKRSSGEPRLPKTHQHPQTKPQENQGMEESQAKTPSPASRGKHGESSDETRQPSSPQTEIYNPTDPVEMPPTRRETTKFDFLENIPRRKKPNYTTMHSENAAYHMGRQDPGPGDAPQGRCQVGFQPRRDALIGFAEDVYRRQEWEDAGGIL